MLRKLGDLFGTAVMATDGEIGRVHDFYFDDHTWSIRYMVIDTGGWLSGRLVLISPVALQPPDWHGRVFPVSLTRQQIEDSPTIHSDMPVSRQHEVELHKYYGWPTYWDGGLFSGNVVDLLPQLLVDSQANSGQSSADDQGRASGGDPHLRSVREVTRYRVQASDGEIGHVGDFVVEEETWKIRYIVVDTHDWLPGKHVLLSPSWIEQVSWEESSAHVGLSRREVKDAPEYHRGMVIDRQYEEALHHHYGRTSHLSKEGAGLPRERENAGSSPSVESGPAAIGSLIAQLASDDGLVRVNARQSLVTIGAPAVALLIEALRDANRQVRWEAAKALSEIVDPAAAPALARALQDREFGVRWLAAEGLIVLGSRGLVPVLRALVEGSDSIRLRQGAHHVLHDLARRGDLTQVLQPVLAALEGIEPSLQVPVAAEAALEALTGAGSQHHDQSEPHRLRKRSGWSQLHNCGGDGQDLSCQ